VIVQRENAVFPEGFDTWGLKSVRPDLKTYDGYQWPFPGSVAIAHDVNETNKDNCPSHRGDGLCVATTWAGMASGGIPARTLLLVATRSSDVLGMGVGKSSRHREVAVVALVDGERLLREDGIGANLRGAYLRGANLDGANLRDANLDGANLRDADLYGANLRGANLVGANLDGARMVGADLGTANLDGANLFGANLVGADLVGADLDGADLYGANLVGADLDGHDLKALAARGAIL
jgi:hypothetical protein